MLRTVLPCLIAAALSGCASVPPQAAGPGLGWRKGLVLQIGDRDSLGPLIDNDCRNEVRSGSDAARRYAEVRYFVGRHAHLRIVPIDDAPPIGAGDAIYFRPFGCGVARAAGPASS